MQRTSKELAEALYGATNKQPAGSTAGSPAPQTGQRGGRELAEAMYGQNGTMPPPARKVTGARK